MGGKKVR